MDEKISVFSSIPSSIPRAMPSRWLSEDTITRFVERFKYAGYINGCCMLCDKPHGMEIGPNLCPHCGCDSQVARQREEVSEAARVAIDAKLNGMGIAFNGAGEKK